MTTSLLRQLLLVHQAVARPRSATDVCLCDRSLEPSRIATCRETARPFGARFQRQASVGEPGGGSVARQA